MQLKCKCRVVDDNSSVHTHQTPFPSSKRTFPEYLRFLSNEYQSGWITPSVVWRFRNHPPGTDCLAYSVWHTNDHWFCGKMSPVASMTSSQLLWINLIDSMCLRSLCVESSSSERELLIEEQVGVSKMHRW